MVNTTEGHLKRTRVNSSTIKSIGYNTQNGLLEIEFLNGDIHHYEKVQSDIYLRFIAAQSYTAYFNDIIRNKYTRI
ncbi:MAG TPA: KTSC domain-containing protein [Bacteroidia bacterium]|jgi:hypothetical protein|nr:KTSC domain-containing protein [Bacteroidia bacterium]